MFINPSKEILFYQGDKTTEKKYHIIFPKTNEDMIKRAKTRREYIDKKIDMVKYFLERIFLKVCKR